MKIGNWKLKIAARKGFSMAEVVISASVLMIMTAGIFLALTGSLNHSMDSRNHIIASELAQEGIELVRNVRDNNLASGVDYNTYFSSNLDSCRIDKDYNYTDSNSISCNNANDVFQLKYNNNFYEHTDGDGTRFYRKIKIADYNSGTGKTITSVVSWNGSAPDANTTTCNVGNKCVYTEAILTER